MGNDFPWIWIVLVGLMASTTTGILAEEPKPQIQFVFGSAHEHASISVMILGQEFDFTQEQYQLQSPYIHFENSNGYVIHRHSQGVTLGYFFETLNVEFSKNCIEFSNQSFCSNEDFTLKYYINEQRVTNINDYLIFDGDYILISYGAENQEQIEEQIDFMKDRGFPFPVRPPEGDFLAKV